MTKKLGFIILGLSFILMSGCSDDSSDYQTPQTIRGVVIGSHYEGAWVCVDLDSNGVCDGETITVTDANGAWILDDPNNSELNVIAEIYVDNIKHSNHPAPPSSTLVENPIIFVAPLKGEVNGQLIVSPISTMVHKSMQENDISFEAAKESVANEVGVSSDVLLTNYDVENPSPDQAILQQQSAVEIDGLELTMSYHDNDVYFQNDHIKSGKYVVKDYYIPSAQDPDHHVRIGTVAHMEIINDNNRWGLGQLNFNLGRKGSTHAANWWKNRVSSDENIYGSEPEKLNFAMKGDLTMTIGGKTYIFEDFYLAQGHFAFGNNWWIGSKDCNNTSDEIMTCNGKDENGNRIKIQFNLYNADEFLMFIK